MHDKAELCEKIRSLHPEIGECGIDLDVDWHTYHKGITIGNTMKVSSAVRKVHFINRLIKVKWNIIQEKARTHKTERDEYYSRINFMKSSSSLADRSIVRSKN